MAIAARAFHDGSIFKFSNAPSPSPPGQSPPVTRYGIDVGGNLHKLSCHSSLGDFQRRQLHTSLFKHTFVCLVRLRRPVENHDHHILAAQLSRYVCPGGMATAAMSSVPGCGIHSVFFEVTPAAEAAHQSPSSLELESACGLASPQNQHQPDRRAPPSNSSAWRSASKIHFRP